MFCNKCGKKIEYEARVCNECLTEENELLKKRISGEPIVQKEAIPASAPSPSESQPTKNETMAGFGKALTSTILSSVAIIFLALAFVFVAAAFSLSQYYFYEEYDYDDTYGTLETSIIEEEPYYSYNYEEEIFVFTFVGVLFLIIGLGMAIPALIMAISSVKLFFRMKNGGRKKPIPALVLGLVGLYNSACNLTLLLFTVILGMFI